jgi:hypothetical protein
MEDDSFNAEVRGVDGTVLALPSLTDVIKDVVSCISTFPMNALLFPEEVDGALCPCTYIVLAVLKIPT